ncbi:MAG: hypothetical protein JWP92_2654 [Caulobacter sp.]|nr:hypothetical protein [Caulobacter sp.]
MAARVPRPNPFGWIVLGFVAGVAVTTVLALTITRHAHDGPELRTAAEQLEGAALSTAPAVVGSPPPAPVQTAPPAAVVAEPAVKPPAPDAQVADDAAAAGMTSRATPDPSTP